MLSAADIKMNKTASAHKESIVIWVRQMCKQINALQNEIQVGYKGSQRKLHKVVIP